MRKQQRRDSAREWIRSGANVTVRAYAKRYGVDTYTAYDDLAAVGFPLPPSAARWVQRPPPAPRSGTQRADGVDDWWILRDGRKFLVVGRTSGGAPYGIFEDESSNGLLPVERVHLRSRHRQSSGQLPAPDHSSVTTSATTLVGWRT